MSHHLYIYDSIVHPIYNIGTAFTVLRLRVKSSKEDLNYFHVPEMMLEAWQNDGGCRGLDKEDDDDKSVEEVSKMRLQLLRNLNENEGKGIKNQKTLESILRVIVCVLSGDPGMALACVTEALLSK